MREGVDTAWRRVEGGIGQWCDTLPEQQTIGTFTIGKKDFYLLVAVECQTQICPQQIFSYESSPIAIGFPVCPVAPVMTYVFILIGFKIM